MRIKDRQYAEALYEAVAGKTQKEAASATDNFVKLLAERNALSRADGIIAAFKEIWNKAHGIIEATAVSARPLDEKTLAALKSRVADRTGAEKVEMSQSIDESILGGVVLSYGDKVLDASLKTAVAGLKDRMAE
jgi:F-type H+-transporting ATPase subunit delta